jgi:hypothetical protein
MRQPGFFKAAVTGAAFFMICGNQTPDASKRTADSNMELKSPVVGRYIDIPATLSDKPQKQIDNLDMKTGKDFDKSYAYLSVTGRNDDMTDFKRKWIKEMILR